MERQHHQPPPASSPLLIDAVFINFKADAISLIAGDVEQAVLRLPGLARFRPSLESIARLATAPAAEPIEPTDTASELTAATRNQTLVLSGRLLEKPRPGRPDRSQKPTLIAKAAMHRAGQAETLMVLASFHSQTVSTVHGWDMDTHFTGEGYLHNPPANDPRKSHTFAVYRLLNLDKRGVDPAPTDSRWQGYAKRVDR